jgi:hypothetical protein
LWCVRHLLRSLRAKCLSGLSLWPFSYFISSNSQADRPQGSV